MLKDKNIYFIRHGETDWNRDNRFQGQTDIPLNQTGKDQASEIIPSMNQLKIEQAFSSDLSRAFETAQISLTDYRIGITKDERLRETHLGDAEGLTAEELIAKFSDQALVRWRSYDEHDLDFKYKNGESKRQMMVRIRDAVLELVKDSESNNIAFFCHGMVMRALTYAFGQGVEWNQITFANGSIHHFKWNDQREDHLIYLGKIEKAF